MPRDGWIAALRVGVALAALATPGWAQAPSAAELGKAVDAHLATVRRAPAEGEDPAAREAAAVALVQIGARSDVDPDVRKRLLAGASACLTGPDNGPRDALLAALGTKGQQAAAAAWKEPLLALALDPDLPVAAMPMAVRRLCDAEVKGIAAAIGARIEDRAQPAPRRRRAVAAASALCEQDLRGWGPVESLVKALDDEELGGDALRVLRRVLVFADDTDKDQIRRWWQANRTRPPANVMAERLRKLQVQVADDGQRTEAWVLRMLDVADAPLALRALEFPAPRVRASAARRLGALDPAAARTALGALTARLEQDAVADVRLACCETLAKVLTAEDAAAVRILLGRQKTEPDPRVRVAGAMALGQAGGAAVVPALVDALKIDTDPGVRRAAAKALQRCGSAVTIDALLPALDPTVEATAEVRAEVARAVGELGQAGGAGVAACVPLARALCDDPDREVRWTAAYWLGLVPCDGTEAVDALALAVAQDAATKVRVQAAEVLGRRRRDGEREPSTAALIGALRDGDTVVRAAARGSLVAIAAKVAPAMVALADRVAPTSRLAEVDLLEAALAVVANGEGTALDAAGRITVRTRLVDLWQRTESEGIEPVEAARRAAVHEAALYTQTPTVLRAHSLAQLYLRGERLDEAIDHLKAAAARFPDEGDALLGRALAALERLATDTHEVRAADALRRLGALPETLRGRGTRLLAAADAARQLAAAVASPATRTEWHQQIATATGAQLAGFVAACLRRLTLSPEIAREADAALQASPVGRPAGLAPLGEASGDAERARARQLWSRAWSDFESKDG